MPTPGGAGSASSDAAGDTSAGGDSSTGGGDATASIDAAALCGAIAYNAPVVQAVDVTDGSAEPAATTYTGGTLPTGRYMMTAVTHYGSQYGGGTSQIIDLDTTAKTMRIADRLNGAVTYTGLQNVVNADAHTLVGDVVCSTAQGLPAQLSWSYTLGTKLTMSLVGSSDVKVYSVPFVP